MCTAITFNSNSPYFGRNLDIECSYGEKIIVIPQNYEFCYKHLSKQKFKYSVMGIGTIVDGHPLLYDAINECGVGVAALRYTDAEYSDVDDNMINITSYELIPYILSSASSCDEAFNLLKSVNITSENFSEELKASKLHWFICDKQKSIVLECTKEKFSIYENTVGVLTNMPDFEKQMFNLNNYMYLSSGQIQNNFSDEIKFNEYSRGMGGIGLPGDYSSMSRFVRASFVKYNTKKSCSKDENCVGQFFHILDSVYQHEGCVIIGKNEYEKTLYSSCYDLDLFSLYYTSYSNRRITKFTPAIKILGSDVITVVNMRVTQDIFNELNNGKIC